MKVHGRHYRTIWEMEGNPERVCVINQNRLPHAFEIQELGTVDDFVRAIRDMYVRGAGLIGATAGYGMFIAAVRAADGTFDEELEDSARLLMATRPTAKNLEWAVRSQLAAMKRASTPDEKREAALENARAIADSDAESCRSIGRHGAELLEELAAGRNGEPLNILTHCNAGWLAFVDYGSATAPIYEAFSRGVPLHVWVDETRPRNQGASLTAWEMVNEGIPHSLIVDNAGGHLMQHGMVDIVIVGTDRVTRTGDVANKIGTYLKALAAHDNGVPFYVALPSSTFDWDISDGVRDIPIEERNPEEVTCVSGIAEGGATSDTVSTVRICPKKTTARNFAFDVTPARLVTGLITERGVCDASEAGIAGLYPETGA